MESALTAGLLAPTYLILLVVERAMPLRAPKARFRQRLRRWETHIAWPP